LILVVLFQGLLRNLQPVSARHGPVFKDKRDG